MPDDRSNEVTVLLGAIASGDNAAAGSLMPIVYDELRALAGAYFRGQRAGHTLEPTALVHEAFIRLTGNPDIAWESRGHFFAVASMAMRNVLADYARRVSAEKRGGGWSRVTLSSVASDGSAEADPVELMDALEKLEEIDERQARIVELRFLAGLTVDEAADLLGVSPRTVQLDWRMARAWLRRELAGGA